MHSTQHHLTFTSHITFSSGDMNHDGLLHHRQGSHSLPLDWMEKPIADRDEDDT